MATPTIRLALLVSDPDSRKAYLDGLTGHDVQCLHASCHNELFDTLMNASCNGLLLDVPTMVRSNAYEKALMHDLIEVFPVLRLRFDRERGRIGALMYGSQTRTSINEFIDTHCRNFSPRKLRVTSRVDVQRSVLLSSDCNFSKESAEKSVTLNISPEGVFIYSTKVWEKGQQAWVVFPNIEPDEPIRTEVRWSRPWGNDFCMPGVGLKFINISPELATRINERLSEP